MYKVLKFDISKLLCKLLEMRHGLQWLSTGLDTVGVVDYVSYCQYRYGPQD
jgi:hypothetical protein